VDDAHTTNSGPRVFLIVHYAISSPPPAASSPIVYDPARNKVWCVNPDSETVSRVDATTLSKEIEMAVGRKPRSITLSPAANQLLISCEDSSELWSLDAATGSLLAKTNVGYGQAPSAVVFAPDGSAAFVAARGGSAVLKVNPASLATVGRCPLPSSPSALAISGDGSRLFLTRFISPDTQGEIWEVAPSTMTLVQTFALAFDNTPDFENSEDPPVSMREFHA
jgi:DNA-binding beta-propeller fold protein YncE